MHTTAAAKTAKLLPPRVASCCLVLPLVASCCLVLPTRAQLAFESFESKLANSKRALQTARVNCKKKMPFANLCHDHAATHAIAPFALCELAYFRMQLAGELVVWRVGPTRARYLASAASAVKAFLSKPWHGCMQVWHVSQHWQLSRVAKHVGYLASILRHCRQTEKT